MAQGMKASARQKKEIVKNASPFHRRQKRLLNPMFTIHSHFRHLYRHENASAKWTRELNVAAASEDFKSRQSTGYQG